MCIVKGLFKGEVYLVHLEPDRQYETIQGNMVIELATYIRHSMKLLTSIVAITEVNKSTGVQNPCCPVIATS